MPSMYAKLFSRITESSLMEEPINVRYTFVMLLAIADPEGYVIGTDVAICRRLNMALNEFKGCVEVLMKPDPDSNSKEQEGRRVIPSDGERGYKVVNFKTYREMKDEKERREYMRQYMRDYREKQGGKRGSSKRKQKLAQLTQGEEEVKEHGEEERDQAPLILGEAEAFKLAWNELPSPFRPIRSMSDGRITSLRARMKDEFWSGNWRNALESLKTSEFCKGKNDRGWIADVDFFLRPDSVAKILEGKYANGSYGSNGNSGIFVMGLQP